MTQSFMLSTLIVQDNAVRLAPQLMITQHVKPQKVSLRG